MKNQLSEDSAQLLKGLQSGVPVLVWNGNLQPLGSLWTRLAIPAVDHFYNFMTSISLLKCFQVKIYQHILSIKFRKTIGYSIICSLCNSV